MSKPFIREEIQKFLKGRTPESPYLIPKWSPSLETQILVHPGSVTVTGEDDCKEWTDGEQVWKNHRWPFNAGTKPYYNDKILTFDPAVHASRIGSTWWNYETCRSEAVAFDIDIDEEHAHTTTSVDKNKRDELLMILSSLPYVTVVRSTGGEGLHVYVFFDKNQQPVAENHHEHTQNALAVLDKMCHDSNYDFNQNIDVKGVVFWFWSDTSPADHQGFNLLSEATEFLTADDIKDFVRPNFRQSGEVKIQGYTESGATASESEQYQPHDLDETHKLILDALEKTGFTFIWNAEYNLAHTHTSALKRVFEEFAEKGNPLKGMFNTFSEGSDKAKPNCYITPRPDGVFKVTRFGHGTSEHPLWSTHKGKTFCFFNSTISPKSILKKFADKVKDNTMTFSAIELEKALNAFGHSLDEAKDIATPIKVSLDVNGIFTATTVKPATIPRGWHPYGKNISWQLPIIQTNQDNESDELKLLELVDQHIRFLVNEDSSVRGWVFKSEGGWIEDPGTTIVNMVATTEFQDRATAAKTIAARNPWIVVCRPFQEEYPAFHVWNYNAPQFHVEPAKERGDHPHWDMIINHIGHGLNNAVEATDWCGRWGITRGADYILYWLASLLQYPSQPLPFLFLYGIQNCGKSILHEAMSMFIIKNGVMNAASALLSTSGFNGELRSTILAYVEEIDLSQKQGGVYNRIKEWTTAPNLTIHRKGSTPFVGPNYLHFIQTANSPFACAVEDGDTRVVVVQVQPLQKSIPKAVFFRSLEKEAPYFLRTLLSIRIPDPIDRLRIPAIATDDKTDLQIAGMSPIEACAMEYLHPCPGESVAVSEFYEYYKRYCEANHLPVESCVLVTRTIKNRVDRYKVGYGKGKKNFIANVSFDKNAIPSEPFILTDNGRLVKGN